MGSLMRSPGTAMAARKAAQLGPWLPTLRALRDPITGHLAPPGASLNRHAAMRTAFQWDRAYSVPFKRSTISDFTLVFAQKKALWYARAVQEPHC